MDLQKTEIDFSNPELLSQYGVGIQKNLANFSEQILTGVKNKETAEIGKLLNDLMLTVRGIDIEGITNPGALTKVWHRVLSELSLFRGGFEKINSQLDTLIKNLEEAKVQLLNDIKNLDQTYEHNLNYLRELEELINVGVEAVIKRNMELSEMQLPSDDYVSHQKLKDQRSILKEFEKRLHDLKLTRTMTLQTLPQIRLIQHNNNELVNKIQSSILNTIPIWKNQIVLSLSLEKQKKVARIQKKINETTNSLLTKNSELLKENSINIAKLSEEGIIETKSLQKVNDDLVSVISGVLQIYQEGKVKRAEAELELQEMERRLKATLAAV